MRLLSKAAIAFAIAVGCPILASAQEGPPSRGVKVCVPEFDNISTRSVNLEVLRERLLKLLQRKKGNVVAVPSEGTAEHPDYGQARDSGCGYVLKVQIRELRYKAEQPALTIGSPRRPDVAEPESLNKRYVARLDFELTGVGSASPIADSVANGESDLELQAASNAEDFVANRVLAELKNKK
jgi:hypothetical protein